ncbi:MAG: glycine--tRNA ligase subunit beta [Proteobacteria bacterium]|nr:glycine--tRNA ligase subunit beta [Pseudomonadota bacterium]
MSELKPLLVEIGTEELPPKALDELTAAFAKGICEGLAKRGIDAEVANAKTYNSPRRLAVLVPGVATMQPAQKSEVLGPYLNIGLDADGTPTPALRGFAAKNGITVEDLQRTSDAKGERFVARSEKPGQPTAALMQDIVAEALKALPIPKPMRWGDHDFAFVRPVHWLVILHGSSVVDAEIFGIKSGRESRGHRFMHPQAVAIADARAYVDSLRAAKVLVDPAERRARVTSEVARAAQATGGTPRLSDPLRDEISNLVEWPYAVACAFEREFLAVPQEALITTMETNQKFVPVFDATGKLTEHFIGVANIESKDPSEIRKGYERVIRPRFADAKFFYDEDRKTSLAAHQEALKSVTYQQQLGSVWDKCVRVAELARVIANRSGVDAALATRAAALSKCDLLTRMVGEFPELQGVMGRYYATADGENADVATALDEFYRPRFAGDGIAQGRIAQVLAIAERLDTLAGIFTVGGKPSGSKDPFALRRAGLGLARTLIEGQFELDLEAVLREAVELLPAIAPPKDSKAAAKSAQADNKQNLTDALLDFIFERLRGYYAEQGFGADQFDAVRAVDPETLPDFDRRLRAVAEFAKLPEAAALAAANKRIGNILKQAADDVGGRVDPALLDAGAERELHEHIEHAVTAIAPLAQANRYVDMLRALAALRAPVDAFFEGVMVMAEDAAKRRNRIALLAGLRRLFLQVADISLLQSA